LCWGPAYKRPRHGALLEDLVDHAVDHVLVWRGERFKGRRDGAHLTDLPLEGPGASYRRIYLALPGHHGRLVRDAVVGLDLPLEDVSISACRGATRSCSTRSFRATSQEYRRWLRREVQAGLGRGSRAGR
jgi:hypothetical protein